MCEKNEAILELLNEVDYSIGLINERFANIKNADDFLSSNENITILDSISMRLLAIGEAFKNIDKLSNNTLLQNYPQIDWKKVKGIRDILSHHYFEISAEIIFDICTNKIGELSQMTKRIILDTKKQR